MDTKELAMKALEERLANVGKSGGIDDEGYEFYYDARLIPHETLSTFLDSSLKMLSMFFSSKNKISWESEKADRFIDLIVQGALLSALSSQALIERGREFSTNDGGCEYNPPNISEILMQQWMLEKDFYLQKLDIIKNTTGF